MTDDNSTDCDGTVERLARGGARRGFRLSPIPPLATGPHALDRGTPCLELTPHFWSTRKREITTMLPIWDRELDDHSIVGVRKMLRTLDRAFKTEKARSRAGHWAGDVIRARNIGYRLDLERRLLAQLEAAR